MNGHAITMLGTGLIGEFYTNTLHGPARARPGRAWSTRAPRSAARRSANGGVCRTPRPTCRRRSSTRHRRGGHRRPELPARGGRRARREGGQGDPVHEAAGPHRRRGAPDARGTVEKAGVFGGYLEDLCYTPKTLKAIALGARAARIGDVTWVRSRETHPGPHSAWFWDGRADRRRRDRRPRLPLHRDHPQLRRQGQQAARGAVPRGHAGPPDRRRGQCGRPDPVRESARLASSR